MAPEQIGPIQEATIVRKRKRRRRRRRMPFFPFVFLILLVAGVFWMVRWAMRLKVHPSGTQAQVATGYVSDIGMLRTEYRHYYGNAIEESRIESLFRRASNLTTEHNYPGAASLLEMLSRDAALPVVYTDLGVTYAMLGDSPRAADALREALARDLNYAPARQFLHTNRVIAPSMADPYTRELEPNNEASTANLIALGSEVSGEIQSGGGDIDYFRVITAAAPRDLVAVELANHSIGFAPHVRIYDANLRIQSWGEKTGQPGESIRLVGGPAPNSSLYISVATEDSKGGQYVLSVRPLRAFDAYEPNDEIMSSRRIALGQEIHANIMDADDTDYYSFQSPRKGSVTIDIRNDSDTLIPAITTYNNDRHNLGFGPELRQPGSGLHQTLNVEKDLTYYIQVWSQAGSSGAYTLRVE